jgi:beta-lactamase regulating signal transducer with metallopeptidase domain
MSWEAGILELLSASLLRPFFLAAAAVILIRAFRVEHPASKHAVWTAVLVCMLILPLLRIAAPHVQIEALPQGTLSRLGSIERETPESVSTHGKDAGGEISDVPPTPMTIALSGNPAPGSSAAPGLLTGLSMPTILAGIYLAGLIAFVAYRVFGWFLLRRLLSRSQRSAFGTLRESADVTIPIAVGLWRPVVVLPIDWRQWPAASRRAVLAHEFAHIRRRDAWVSALSRVVRCIFWFHPLAWYLSRKVSELAEMACDAAAVERVGNPGTYSQILVDFAGIVNRRGYRASLPGLAMIGRSRLGRRIDNVFAVSTGNPRKLARPALVLGLVGAPILAAAATLGLTEAVRPLHQVQSAVTTKLETVAEVATTSGIVAAIAEVIPPGAAAPEPVQSAFNPRAFLDKYCVSCHGPVNSRYASLNFADQDVSQVRANPQVWERVAVRIRAGLEPHPQASPRPTAAELTELANWLEKELDRNAEPYMPPPGPHRLNRAEYANAIRDLLGLEVNPSLLLPGDDSSFGFDNIASTLTTSAELASAFATAGERVSGLALSDSASRQKILICRPSSSDEGQEPCARRIITNLAARAFRKPPSEADVDALMVVYRRGDTGWPYETGIRNVVKSILTDSRFLNRTETEPAGVASGQTYRIRDLELASRLSYFLWSRGPDEQLLDVAGRGQLSNPIVLEQETRRLLKDPRAQALTVNFAAQWLNLRALRMVGPMVAYPDFDEQLQQAMQRETELFFSSIVQEDRNVVDLLTANYTFLNERLARHYGIPNVFGDEFRRVELGPAFDVRRGLMGKGAFLTVTSRPDRTSLTTRGTLYLYMFLGVHPPDPPPNVPALATQPTAGDRSLPMRLLMEQHTLNQACVNCHRFTDPIGIALDNFDQAGKWRTQQGGVPIDPSTELIDGTKINGPVDLRNALVSRSNQFVRTLTQKLLTYGLGRGLDYRDMPMVRGIARDAARENNRFSSLVLGIVKSPVFQMNSKS